MNYYYNTIIIGGGASGLLCAIKAKQKNKNSKIAIIEKNEKIAKKLLATGNGRCNLTNSNISKNNYLGSFSDSLDVILNKYDSTYLINQFNKLGLLTFCDDTGRYYPLSKQASSVFDVLQFNCTALGLDIFCNQNINSINNKNSFIITTDESTYKCEKLVIATGSNASVKSYNIDPIQKLLTSKGHNIIAFKSALCPIKVKSNILKQLKGVRATGKATLLDKNKNIIKNEDGEIQFTENALSGICIFNLSLYSKKDYTINIDLLPDYNITEIINILNAHKTKFCNLTADNLLCGIFQRKLCLAIIKTAKINGNLLCKSITDKQINFIAQTIKHFSFCVIDNDTLQHSQCAKGGIKGTEINPYTMESKKCKNLYFCGEAIDICGDCGGYNLHFAFSTGLIIGENI